MSEPLRAVEAEATTSPDGVVTPLVTDEGDFEVVVLPPGRWKSRATHALRQGDFEEWAALCLADDGFAVWTEADPTNDDIEVFFKKWAESSGESLGGSKPSQRSSRSTARR